MTGPGFVMAIVLSCEGNLQAEAPREELVGLGEIERSITQLEYEISWQAIPPLLEGAYQAPNRAQGFRTWFTPGGIRIVPRGGTTPTRSGPDGSRAADWSFRLALAGIGREGAIEPVSSATLRPGGDRIDYERDRIVEWYRNGPDGLEHVVTLQAPPLGNAAGRVVLELAVGGTLVPLPDRDGPGIDFAAQGARVVRYTGLRVTDAAGTSLRAKMKRSIVRSGIRVFFDDRGAVYPVRVGAVAINPAWTREADQATAHFGWSVASAGDVNHDGYSDVIVGAYLFDNGQTDEGRAFVYLGSPSGLATTPSWTGESDQASAFFGFSVATAGDVNGDGYSDVIVGATQYDNGQTNEGRAFLYPGSASGPSLIPSWTAESDQASAQLGRSVGTAGDVDGDGYADAIVGAPLYGNSELSEGRAYVYLGSASGLATTAAWIGESDQANALFGNSAATAGDVNGDGYDDVVVGAYQFANGQLNEGRAFLYLGSVSGLSHTPSWMAESDLATASFGFAVAPAGDVNGDGFADIAVGSFGFDNVQIDEGRAFVYLGSAAGLSTAPAWTAESDQMGAGIGSSLSAAGDVNGDGYGDLVVGAFRWDNGQLDEGRAYLFLGSAAGLDASPWWTAESNKSGAELGRSVAAAGDVDGDGFPDVIVGAPSYSNGQADEGRALVYLGSGTAAGQVGPSLTIARAPLDQIALGWGGSCAGSDTDYAVYEGTLGSFASHVPRSCTTAGATSFTLSPQAGDSYYLIVPRNDVREGSYGTDSAGAERPVGPSQCTPQQLGACSR